MSKPRESYESYDGFLQAAIREYWDSGRASRVNFLALLLASREAWSVAWDGVAGGGKKILAGAAGAAALGLLLRVVVGGPIGLLLGGATIASLVALYVRNHRVIWAKVDRYKVLLDQFRPRFEEIRGDYLDGHLRTDQRDLMMDGLMTRLLDELDAYDDELEAEKDERAESEGRRGRASDRDEPRGDFARHAAERRAAEERDREREREE